MTRIRSITTKPSPGDIFYVGSFRQGWIIENGKKVFAAFTQTINSDGGVRYERMELGGVMLRAARWLGFTA